MSVLDHWPHRWFGVWREYGPAYQECPSVRDFVRPEVNAGYDKKRLRRYLTTAHVVASSSRRSFPSPFSGERRSGSISFRTDGKWLWLDDLADYIEDFGLALPSAFLQEIERNDYTPPPVDAAAINRLEWPPVTRAGNDPGRRQAR